LFFIQAEDGIRDRNVTGVQTYALPISGQGSTVCSFPLAPRSRSTGRSDLQGAERADRPRAGDHGSGARDPQSPWSSEGTEESAGVDGAGGRGRNIGTPPVERHLRGTGRLKRLQT